jgi:type VI secretion system secreted protein Hcp
MNALIMDMGTEVRGEYSLDDFKGKLELLSFSHGVAMQITGDISSNDRTSGKPNHQDMTVTKYLDAASPVLNQACCEGKAFPKVEIIVGHNDGGKVVEWMRYTLKDVLISSISTGGGGGDKPVEAVTLNYNHITWKHTSRQPESGSQATTEAKWDLARNTAK